MFNFDISSFTINYFLSHTSYIIIKSALFDEIPSNLKLIDETNILNTINLIVLDYMNKGFFRINSNNTVIKHFKQVKPFRYSYFTNRYHPSLVFLEILKKTQIFKTSEIQSDIFEANDRRSLDKII